MGVLFDRIGEPGEAARHAALECRICCGQRQQCSSRRRTFLRRCRIWPALVLAPRPEADFLFGARIIDRRPGRSPAAVGMLGGHQPAPRPGSPDSNRAARRSAHAIALEPCRDRVLVIRLMLVAEPKRNQTAVVALLRFEILHAALDRGPDSGAQRRMRRVRMSFAFVFQNRCHAASARSACAVKSVPLSSDCCELFSHMIGRPAAVFVL